MYCAHIYAPAGECESEILFGYRSDFMCDYIISIAYCQKQQSHGQMECVCAPPPLTASSEIEMNVWIIECSPEFFVSNKFENER